MDARHRCVTVLRLIVLTMLGVTACGRERAPHPAAVEASVIALAVQERSNDAPSVATWGQRVAVVWTASTENTSDIYASISTDGGATFGPPTRVNDIDGDARASGEQAARVVIGPGDVTHVVWPARQDGRSVIRRAVSIDGGRSFSSATSLTADTLTGLRGWQSVALGHDGGVHAVWLDGRNAAPSDVRKGRRHAHGGQHTAKPGVATDGAPRQDIFHASWLKTDAPSERPVASHVCFCCKTAVATSGTRVYVAWRHIYPGSIRDIAVARSSDNGQTFGEPARLSEDDWKIAGCPDDGPAMAADGHGGIHLAWPTFVPGETPRKGIFYASLTDAGTFTPRLRLDAGTADPAHPQLASDVHGTSAVVWDERAENSRRIVLRRVTNGTPVAPLTFEGQGVSYPAIAAGDGYWVTVWSVQHPDGRSTIEGRRIPFGPSGH